MSRESKDIWLLAAIAVTVVLLSRKAPPAQVELSTITAAATEAAATIGSAPMAPI
jgi:hypothetical protein